MKSRKLLTYIYLALALSSLLILNALASSKRVEQRANLGNLLSGYQFATEAERRDRQKAMQEVISDIDVALGETLRKYPDSLGVDALVSLEDRDTKKSREILSDFGKKLASSLPDLLGRQRYRVALARVEIIRRLNTLTFPEDYLNASLTYCRNGETAMAAELAEKGSLAFPDDAKLANNSGFFFLELAELSKSEAALKRALILDPSFAIAQNNLGLLREKQGNFGESLKLLKQAYELDPELEGLAVDLERLKQRVELLVTDPTQAGSIPIPHDQYCNPPVSLPKGTVTSVPKKKSQNVKTEDSMYQAEVIER